MTRLNSFALLAFIFTLPVARAATPFAMSENVQLSVDSVHIPAGFSDGTAQAVTVEIPLRDSCYHFDKIERTDASPTQHQFKVYGHLNKQGMCMMVFRYVQHDVILTNLVPGQHELIFENGDGTTVTKQLTVNHSL